MSDSLKPKIIKDSVNYAGDTAANISDAVATAADTLSSAVAPHCPAYTGNYMWVFDGNEPVEILWMSKDLASIVIPAGITIVIFGIGLFATWYSEKCKRKAELESMKVVLTTWVTLLKSPVVQQAMNVRTFCQNLRQSVDIQPERMSINLLLASKLSSIELKELIQVIVVNSAGSDEDKAKDLFSVVSQIEFINETEKIIPVAYETYNSHCLTLMEHWNILLDEFYAIRGNMIVQFGGTPGDPHHGLTHQFIHVATAFSNQFPQGATITDTDQHLLHPLMAHVMAFLVVNPGSPVANQLEHQIQRMRMIVNQKLVHFEGNAVVFYDLAIRLIFVYKTLVRATERIEDRPLKSVLKIK
jgi:hypothetical protein